MADTLSDTSSPLTVDDNVVVKDNEGTQQNKFVTTPSENGTQNGVSLNGQPGKVTRDEGEDSNHAPSVARYFRFDSLCSNISYKHTTVFLMVYIFYLIYHVKIFN